MFVLPLFFFRTSNQASIHPSTKLLFSKKKEEKETFSLSFVVLMRKARAEKEEVSFVSERRRKKRRMCPHKVLPHSFRERQKVWRERGRDRFCLGLGPQHFFPVCSLRYAEAIRSRRRFSAEVRGRRRGSGMKTKKRTEEGQKKRIGGCQKSFFPTSDPTLFATFFFFSHLFVFFRILSSLILLFFTSFASSLPVSFLRTLSLYFCLGLLLLLVVSLPSFGERKRRKEKRKGMLLSVLLLRIGFLFLHFLSLLLFV